MPIGTEGSDIQGTTYSGSAGSSESSQASKLASQGKEKAKQYGGMARDMAIHRADNKKGDLVKSLQGFVSTLENASRDSDGVTRQVLDSTVGYVRQFSDRIENSSSEELIQDARRVVREKPAAFFAGCFAVGFLAARLIKD
jgi:hypothetical protein